MPPMPRQDARTHDVLIVGGGLVGASLAIALEATGRDVGMVEATPAWLFMPTPTTEIFATFVSAISRLKPMASRWFWPVQYWS